MGGIGFRDLRIFNEALLAKQGWRLLTMEDFLAYKTIKDKYFPKISFIEAWRGENSSYTRRSIWGAKSLLKEGLRWQIGNGANV